MNGYFEETEHIFVIRVRLESIPTSKTPSKWRGTIEHIPTGKKQSIDKLDDVLNFVGGYLELKYQDTQPKLKLRRWVKQILFREANE